MQFCGNWWEWNDILAGTGRNGIEVLRGWVGMEDKLDGTGGDGNDIWRGAMRKGVISVTCRSLLVPKKQ